MLVRTWWHWRQDVFFSLLFAEVSPGPNFEEFQKTRAGGPLGKFDIARPPGHFGRRGLQQNVVLGWHFKEMQVTTWWHWRPGVFSGFFFCRSFPWSQLCRISENARWGSPWQIWHSSASRELWEVRFAAKCSARVALQENFSYNMMALAPGCFFCPSFCRSFPWSKLCRISENAQWGSLWQIWHSSASRELWEAQFAAKCFARFALKGNST